MEFTTWKEMFLEFFEASRKDTQIWDNINKLIGGFDGELYNNTCRFTSLVEKLLSMGDASLLEDIQYVVYECDSTNDEDCTVWDENDNVLYNGKDLDSFLKYVEKTYFNSNNFEIA